MKLDKPIFYREQRRKQHSLFNLIIKRNKMFQNISNIVNTFCENSIDDL